MFKKFFAVILSSMIMTSNVFACWFTQDNFQNAYIAGVNYYQAHYNPNQTTNNNISNAVYHNGFGVSFPLTLWFKVSPRQNGLSTYNIRVTKLYFKVIPSASVSSASSGNQPSTCKWYLVKTIDMGDNPKWSLNFNSPVKLFGNKTITKSFIQNKTGTTLNKGDNIIFAWYIADNSPSCISNADLITQGSNTPVFYPGSNDSSNVVYSGDWYPAYVIRVVYNGLKTPGR